MKLHLFSASREPILLLLIFQVIIAILLLASQVEQITCQEVFYQIPNPFDETALKSKSYYAIKSYQTTVSSHKKKTQLHVQEYISLNTGITFSLHSNQDDSSQSFVLINDGPNARYYIVRNPMMNADQDVSAKNLAVDCELDHLHHHRRIFPWQFVYDMKDVAEDGDTQTTTKKNKRKKKKKGWSSKRSVYGVAGILLNAIERKLVSKDVGEQSPYSATNLWIMRENDLEVKFLFEKPSETAESGDPTQRLLDSSQLDSIQLTRTPLIESDPDLGGVVVPDSSFDNILIESFESNVNPTSAPILRQLHYQLARCRKDNRASRLFPSLIRAVNMSPDRMYAIHYLEHKFGTQAIGTGKFDSTKHRHVREIELHAEWFSFPLETQVTIYEGIPEFPDPEDKVHVFLKRFTDKAGTVSSTHSTVQYHLVESDLGIEKCTVGESDPSTRWFKLLNRPVHFYRPSGVRLTGIQTGLGALLMNAADNNHKQFNFFKKEISIAYDATNIKARKKTLTDEWKLIDEKSARTVHFYFRQPESQFEDHRIGDLVRIDIRDLKPDDPAPNNQSVIVDSAQDDLNDYDLIVRYDILKLECIKSESDMNFIFNKPQICEEQKSEKPSTSDEEEKEKGWETETETEPDDKLENEYHHISIESDSDEAEDEADNEKDQNDGEDFEFEPGTFTMSSPFPDYFNYIEGAESTYGFLSTIELLQPNENANLTGKKVYLKEIINLGMNLARFSVFYSHSSLISSTPDLDYYINYNSEIMLNYTLSQCSVVDDFQPWLRLFSSKVTYYRTNAIHTSITESNKVRMYGVSGLWRQASESPYTDFLGAKRKLLNDTQGNSYKELIWTLMEDNDSNMELRFKFLLNVTSNRKVAEEREKPLKLYSIYINRLFDDDEYEGHFKKFIIKDVQMFQMSDISLPESCQDTLREHKSGSYASAMVELPSFDNFFHSSNGYTAHYIVTQAADTNTANEKLTSYQVTESYDGHLDYGRFTIGYGPETRELFINSKKNTLYLFAMGVCKRIRNLHGLVDVNSEFLADDTDFREGKLYGLAQLLSRISQRKDFVLEIEIRHDATGNKYERRIYRNKGELITSGAKMVVYDIELIFIVKIYQDAGTDEDYELVSIDFTPKFFTSDQRFQIQNMHRTTIEILNMIKNAPNLSWYLPDECDKLDNPLSPSEPRPHFPSLSSLIGRQGFYIRSEISSSSPLQGETEKVFILDEWKRASDLRLKSYGLKKNFDLMIYGFTRESFDLSTNYRCSNELPTLHTEYRNNGKRSLLDLLAENKSYVESLSELYYSPIALWTLAENNPATVSLSNTVELAPSAKSGTLLDMIEREMKSETWLVQHSMAKWSYEMTFERHSMEFEDSTFKTWLVLSAIKVTDSPNPNRVVEGKKVVDIDIINYRYRNGSDHIMQEKLKLPEGYGCVRGKEVLEDYKTSNDDLLLDRNRPYYIWYEASLEKVIKSQNDPELGSIVLSRAALPTAVGTFMKSADWVKVAPYMNLRVHYSSMRHLNGTRSTSKLVIDETSDLLFRINRKSGHCEIGRKENEDWTIEFPDESGVQKLRIDEYKFLALFSPNSSSFNPLNRYTDEHGRSISEYEDTLYSLRLTDKLDGPVSIIRRFERAENERLPFLIKDLKIVKFHSSVLVKVLLFNMARTKLTAVLHFNLRLVTPIHLSELVEHIDVATCYVDGTRKLDNQRRTFAIEYECQQPNHDDFYSGLVKDKFLTQLMMHSQFLPNQISGTPIMDYDDNGHLIKFTFNILDPPTSLEFNTRFLPRSRMTLDMELRAEVKLVSSIWDCSLWCDYIGCVAMSYCVDHTCRVITPSILMNNTDNRYLNKKEILPLINSIADSDCSYLYRVGRRPRTVQSFADFMDVSLNSGVNLTEFRLETGKFCGSINPTKFYEIKNQFESVEEEEDLDGIRKTGNVYIELRKDYKLDEAKLEDLNTDFKSLIKQPISSYSECMAACDSENCQLFSYCKEQSYCLIVTGFGDLKILESSLEPAEEKLWWFYAYFVSEIFDH